MSSTAAIAAIHLDGTMRSFKEERLAGVKYVDRVCTRSLLSGTTLQIGQQAAAPGMAGLA